MSYECLARNLLFVSLILLAFMRDFHCHHKREKMFDILQIVLSAKQPESERAILGR